MGVPPPPGAYPYAPPPPAGYPAAPPPPGAYAAAPPPAGYPGGYPGEDKRRADSRRAEEAGAGACAAQPARCEGRCFLLALEAAYCYGDDQSTPAHLLIRSAGPAFVRLNAPQAPRPRADTPVPMPRERRRRPPLARASRPPVMGGKRSGGADN